MIQIAPIPPTSLIPYTVESFDYQFLLLHEMLDERNKLTEYAKSYYREFSNRTNPDCFVILDNGAFELGVSESTEKIRRILDHFEGCIDEVILPDRMFFMDETLDLSSRGLEELEKYRTRFMFVPHGRTPMEWLKCLRSFLVNWYFLDKDFLTIGIAKDYGIWDGGRELLTILARHETNSDIHYLGMWNNVYEYSDFGLSVKSQIRSADTAKPFIVSHYPQEVGGFQQKFPRPNNYFQMEKTEFDMNIFTEIVEAWREAGRT